MVMLTSVIHVSASQRLLRKKVQMRAGLIGTSLGDVEDRTTLRASICYRVH